uniref:SHSP domain-containing protein n=2 Tax=Oryza brachyantha TaxID=4533 RepID=J3LK76_ORYBR
MGAAGEVRVRTVRIHPGVVRVVVQAGAGGVEDDDDMELDKWRSRLPEGSCPAMAVAGYVNGQLVVTVPKGRDGSEGDNEGGDEAWRCCNGGKISSRLVVVQ